jgi:hypothetical protein
MIKWTYCKNCGWNKKLSNDDTDFKCPSCNKLLWYLVLSEKEMNLFEQKISEVGILNFVDTVREFY